MNTRTVRVPVSLLKDQGQTPSFKVLWMALRLEPGAGPAKLETLTGLSRNTIRSAVPRIAAYKELRVAMPVQMPAALLAERSVGPQAKLLYGLLLTLGRSGDHTVQYTRASIQGLTSLSRTTITKAMSQLLNAGWVSPIPKVRRRPALYKLGTPAQRRAEAEALAAAARLKVGHRGEVLMHEWLSLLVDLDLFATNTKESWLRNPLTGQLLELDRYYPSAKVAFEFHGDQHETASAKYPQEQVDSQRVRDYIKAGLCKYEGVHLIIIRACDLSLEGMLRKIGQSLPLRSLEGHQPLIDLLQDESMRYEITAEANQRSRR